MVSRRERDPSKLEIALRLPREVTLSVKEIATRLPARRTLASLRCDRR